MKLISMTDFVLERHKENGQGHEDYEYTAIECIKYANFLKQPLTLGMFVPVDEEEYVLEEPLQ